jgi:hypothetical protein
MHSIERPHAIESKIFNRHRLWENLRLALTFPDRIDPVGVPDPRANSPG